MLTVLHLPDGATCFLLLQLLNFGLIFDDLHILPGTTTISGKYVYIIVYTYYIYIYIFIDIYIDILYNYIYMYIIYIYKYIYI